MNEHGAQEPTSAHKLFDRASGKLLESQEPAGGLLNRLYGSAAGRFFLNAFLARPATSAVVGRALRTRASKRLIAPFVERNGIDLTGFAPLESYKSYEDFFERERLEPTPTSHAEHELVAAADSRLFAFAFDDWRLARVNAKGTTYPLASLVLLPAKGHARSAQAVATSSMTRLPKAGTVLVFRLSLSDCHHFVCPFAASWKASYCIDGELHSVREVAQGERPYSRNKRWVDLLELSSTHELAAMIAIGALLVGEIRHIPFVDRMTLAAGDELGCFELGGSSIVLVVPQSVHVDEDILFHSHNGVETLVRAGDIIGSITAQETRG